MGTSLEGHNQLTRDAKIEEYATSLSKYIQVLTFHQVVSPATQTSGVPGMEAPKPRVWWLVPFDRNSSFVGRHDVFVEVEAALTSKEGTQPKTALWGLGGIGWVSATSPI